MNWFNAFFTNRSQKVKIKHSFSNAKDIVYGVPQGGVLGPIVFTMYIHDLLEKAYNLKIYAFADDTSLVCLTNDFVLLQNKISDDLKTVSE